MIVFETDQKRKYNVFKVEGESKSELCSLDLVFSPATNKFDKIVEFVQDASIVLGSEFEDWFCKFISNYIKSGYNYSVVRDNLHTLMEMADKYIEAKGINFEDYIDRKKISSNSIFFDAEEIKKMVQVSNYLKLYFIISQDNVMKLPTRFHREIYSVLVEKISSTDILFKLFKIVASKTYRYTITDQYMWEYIRLTCCKTPDMQIMTIFNFIVNNILATCDTEENPIPFIISVIDEAIRWILKSVYEDVIIYTDTIRTEDAYISSDRDNLQTYAYNDTIGRLVVLAYNCLEAQEIDDVKFNEAIRSHQEVSLFSTYVTYPILSKVLQIPYMHFLTVPVEHGYLLNILLYHYLPDSFKRKYQTMCEFLLYHNKSRPIVKTTYRLKNIEEFSKTSGEFKGFRNIAFTYDFYSQVVGKIARNEYASLKTQTDVKNLPLAKVECDLVQFYNDLFDGRLDDTLSDLTKTIETIL